MPFQPLDGSVQADVIGGGFTGINTAIELIERGLTVRVLEQTRIGRGASGRNGRHVTGSQSGDGAMAREFRRVQGMQPTIPSGPCAGGAMRSSGRGWRGSASPAT